MQIRKGFIFENNENLRQLEEVKKRFPTYLVSPLEYENHALINVIKYFYMIFQQNFEYRISNNEPAANFTYIFQPYAPIQNKIENGNGEYAKETTTRP